MRNDNRGSATIEASLALPIFIFAVLVMFHGIRLRMAEAIIYEAAAETVEYMAELSYITECNYGVPAVKLKQYIDDKKLVENYVVGGVDGVSFLGSTYLDEEGYVCLRVNYSVGIDVPIIGDLSGKREYVIRQRAYIGDGDKNKGDELSPEEIYVYITDNREVYHLSRGCSHLDLSITPMSKKQAKMEGYSSCQFCGQNAKEAVLVTNQGDRYHSYPDCLGIKRTVYRVKKSQVEGLGACERCGY